VIAIAFYAFTLLLTRYLDGKRKEIKNLQDPSIEWPGTSYKFPLGDTMMYTDYNGYVKTYGTRFQKWGGFLFWVAHQPIISFLKPEYIKDLMTKPEELYERDFHHQYLRMLFGVGLIGVSGETWKKQHRIMQKAFSTTNIINFFPLFVEIAQARFASVHKAAEEGKPIDMNIVMNEIAAEVIIRSAFGCKGKQADMMMRGFQQILEAYSPLLRIPGALNTPLPSAQKFSKAFNIVQTLGDEIVAERREILKRRKEAGSKEEEAGYTLVDLLIEARDDETGTYLSDQELKDNARTFLAAGSETTATAMSWFLYNLTRNPEVWEKVVQEVDQVVPDDISTFSYQHLAKFNYLTLAINESLRVTPSVSLITPRVPTEDIQIGEWLFPKGSYLSFSIPLVHFNDENYEEPEKFKPERWEDGNDKKRPYSYVPFGAGRRVCIGKYFGLLEMKVVLGLFLKQFAFKRPPKADGSQNNDVIEKAYRVPVLHLEGGLPVYVEKRPLKTTSS